MSCKFNFSLAFYFDVENIEQIETKQVNVSDLRSFLNPCESAEKTSPFERSLDVLSCLVSGEVSGELAGLCITEPTSLNTDNVSPDSDDEDKAQPGQCPPQLSR